MVTRKRDERAAPAPARRGGGGGHRWSCRHRGWPASGHPQVRELRGSYREDDNPLLMPTRVAIAALVSVHLRASFERIGSRNQRVVCKQAGLERGATGAELC